MPASSNNQDLDLRQLGAQFGSLSRPIPSGPATPGLLDGPPYNPSAGGPNNGNGNAGGPPHNAPRSSGPWSSLNPRGQN
ncbi:hypothetical protein N7540_002326 [Penicillium herquei]|nr:hypothetical protein N7540_002326 [Penicillium herquei]